VCHLAGISTPGKTQFNLVSYILWQGGRGSAAHSTCIHEIHRVYIAIYCLAYSSRLEDTCIFVHTIIVYNYTLKCFLLCVFIQVWELHSHPSAILTLPSLLAVLYLAVATSYVGFQQQALLCISAHAHVLMTRTCRETYANHVGYKQMTFESICLYCCRVLAGEVMCSKSLAYVMLGI
jgi:hypothetical protein